MNETSPVDQAACGVVCNKLQFQTDILTLLRDGVSIISADDGIFRYTNPAFDTMFGYAAGELIGQHVSILNAETDRSPQEVAREIIGMLEKSGKWNGDLLNRRKDGQTFWTNSQISTSLSAEWGRFWITIQRDITNRKLTEKALKDEQERLALALKGSGLALWDWDVPTGHVAFGERWYEMLGYPPDSVTRHIDYWLPHFDPVQLKRIEETLGKFLAGEMPVLHLEYRLRHKEGYWIVVESTGKVAERDAAGNPLRVLGTIKDISQTNRLSVEGVDLLKRIEGLIHDATSRSSHSTAGQDALIDSLTSRQRQIMGMIASGLTSAEIGKHLNLSPNTVVSHRRSLMAKLDLHTTADLTRLAMKHGLMAPK